ncbi:YopX family protein [Paenibacillus sp. FSL H8-0259]|uniref:YopX family protein n=1 Tax=Paenibacillus sp. FSL H8-0259 TaxID=1920423 RepID=UPI00096BED09|nr:YopX family protein [Paenibacillus sp. FSL H8-0259]OMF30933.1 hypothetical protein BK132_05755 [Paenibacillus sp. FSL H8-0259]
MREIKFRAWDKERKEMRQIQLMDWSAWWVSTGTTWERGNTLEFGERYSFKNEKTDRHILMQFTGLTDDNGRGREMYEGDIYQSEGRLYVIEWSEYSLGWVVRSLKTKQVLPGYLQGEVAVYDDYVYKGTIYENPELLEV